MQWLSKTDSGVDLTHTCLQISFIGPLGTLAHKFSSYALKINVAHVSRPQNKWVLLYRVKQRDWDQPGATICYAFCITLLHLTLDSFKWGRDCHCLSAFGQPGVQRYGNPGQGWANWWLIVSKGEQQVLSGPVMQHRVPRLYSPGLHPHSKARWFSSKVIHIMVNC